jgi:hypothetical protein
LRYYKGSLVLSEKQDIPLLLHVRNARAITFNQLCQVLALDSIETVRHSVHWRVARLTRNGLIQRLESDRRSASPVLTITSVGLDYLEAFGEFLLALPSTANHIIQPAQVPHALELVNVRIALARSGMLESWKGELEITSRNLVRDGEPAKDYDALVEIRATTETTVFAVEYERTVKSTNRYQEIRRALCADSSAKIVLYLTPDRHLLYHLAMEMKGIPKKIGFALVSSFCRDLLNTKTLVNQEESGVVSFRQLLIA